MKLRSFCVRTSRLSISSTTSQFCLSALHTWAWPGLAEDEEEEEEGEDGDDNSELQLEASTPAPVTAQRFSDGTHVRVRAHDGQHHDSISAPPPLGAGGTASPAGLSARSPAQAFAPRANAADEEE